MSEKFSLDELKYFIGSEAIFQHWISKMCYTEGVKYLANRTSSYWLIDELAFVILPKLLKENRDQFYLVELSVNSDKSAVISISNGNGNIYLNHPIK